MSFVDAAAPIARRAFCAGAAGLAGAAALPAFAAEGTAQWVRRLGEIERKAPEGSQLGVYIYDMARGRGFGWRVGQRFAMCSSFKLSLAALVLQRIAEGKLKGDERIRYRKTDLLENSPRSALHLGDGMTLVELAEAAQTLSDNTAANLLLKRIGGPAELTRFWRSLDDTVTRLDDIEPALNRVPIGDPRNTTTPRAMALTVAKFAGNGLAPAARTRLLTWMNLTETGKARLRAGFPADWWSGDKTGTGFPADAPATTVDLAVAYAAKGPPFVVTSFLRSAAPLADFDPAAETTLAAVGALAARWAGT